MPPIIKQDVLEFDSGLASVRDPAWAAILAFANTVSPEGVDPKGGEDSPIVRLLRIYLAAHYATVSKRSKSGAVGPVTSEAAGPIRRSYGLVALASSDASLGATTWGQQYLGLLQMTVANLPLLI